MNIKEKRTSINMTQQELAKILGVSIRTISRYENGKIDKYKNEYILKILEERSRIDEEHGILTLNNIIEGVNEVTQDYSVEFIYLFGSYATGNAEALSDVDLLIKTEEKGLKYFGLVEDLRKTLKKKVDVININDLVNNKELLLAILKEGIKIYDWGQR